MLGGGHEHLATRCVRFFQQRQKGAPAGGVQFAHNVINQQQWRSAVDTGEIFGLRQLERNGQRALLAFAGKLCHGAAVEQQLKIVAMRTDHGCAISPLARSGLRKSDREILAHTGKVFEAHILHFSGDAVISPSGDG